MKRCMVSEMKRHIIVLFMAEIVLRAGSWEESFFLTHPRRYRVVARRRFAGVYSEVTVGL